MRGIDVGIEMMEVSQDGKNWLERYELRVGTKWIPVGVDVSTND